MKSCVHIVTESMFVDSNSFFDEALGACSYTIWYLVYIYCGRKSGYMEYTQMAHHCSCHPLPEQLSGHHQSLLWDRIRPFFYGSGEPIFILLVYGGFTWIPHAISIIYKETHHMQNILKKIDHVSFFSRGCCLSIYSLSFLHITGSDKKSQGVRS